jgi:hypothetical protein
VLIVIPGLLFCEDSIDLITHTLPGYGMKTAILSFPQRTTDKNQLILSGIAQFCNLLTLRAFYN